MNSGPKHVLRLVVKNCLEDRQNKTDTLTENKLMFARKEGGGGTDEMGDRD